MKKKTKIIMGINALGVLQIVFIVLKVIGVISWPWVNVFLPVIIPSGIAGGLLGIVGIVIGVRELINEIQYRKFIKITTEKKQLKKEYENEHSFYNTIDDELLKQHKTEDLKRQMKNSSNEERILALKEERNRLNEEAKTLVMEEKGKRINLIKK